MMAEEVHEVAEKVEPNGATGEDIPIAQEPMEGMDTQMRDPEAMMIEQPMSQQMQLQDPGPIEDRKLFIGGLSSEINKESLREFFEAFGPVEAVDVKVDPMDRKKHKGFAFVTMADVNSVEKILDGQKCKRHKIGNKFSECKKALSPSDYQAMKNRTKKVFVGGVPTDLAKETLEEYFIQFGEMEEVALVTEKGNRDKRRGFVFVTYKSFDSVDACVAETFHTVHGFKLEVKRATPRETNPSYGLGGFPRGRGGGRGGWAPYGVDSYGGYGGYSDDMYYDGYGDPGFYGPPARGGWGSRYGPMKGNPHSRGFHPYGR